MVVVGRRSVTPDASHHASPGSPDACPRPGARDGLHVFRWRLASAGQSAAVVDWQPPDPACPSTARSGTWHLREDPAWRVFHVQRWLPWLLGASGCSCEDPVGSIQRGGSHGIHQACLTISWSAPGLPTVCAAWQCRCPIPLAGVLEATFCSLALLACHCQGFPSA